MPNSLDEEETQCLLASEDALTSNFFDEPDDILDKQNGDSRNRASAKMKSSASSNNLFPRDSSLGTRTFDTSPSPSRLSSVSTASVFLPSNTGTCSKDNVTTDFVVPSLGKYGVLLYFTWA